MLIVAKFQRGEIRKITVLTAVMARTNEYTRPEKNACLSIGKLMRRKVTAPVAPSIVEASSIDLSICKSVEVPASIPTGIFLNANAIISKKADPVHINGLSLNARIYPIPTTVPGTAKSAWR